MRIELLQAWKIWPIGHVIPAMPDNQARELIRRGVAKEQAVESRAIRSPLDRMMPSPARKATKGH